MSSRGWVAPIMLEPDVHDIDVIFAAEDDGIVSRLDAKASVRSASSASPP